MSRIDHGLETGWYVKNGEKQRMRIGCLCGWTSAPHGSWKDAGAALDKHVAEIEARSKALAQKADQP